MLRNKGTLLLGLAVLVLFFYGSVQLVLLRLETGDVYPPYSSLRSDPLGTKALFESLQTCCGLKVERNYEPFVEVSQRKHAAVLFLGVEDMEMDAVPKPLAGEFNSFVQNGGRLVFTFLPKNETSLRGSVKKAIERQKGKEKKDEEHIPEMVSLDEEWGVEFANSELPAVKKETARLFDTGLLLPSQVACHTSLYFRNLDPAWQVLYEREAKPVLIERKLGNGTIVFSALSYFLSNEAMLKERHADLLAWIVGDEPEVIFDEYHHGISASPGVAALGRKYHLEWFFFGLLLLSVLFLWRSAVPLVPPFDDSDSAHNGTRGKESAEGLTNLLRRNIPARQILSVCYQEWKKSQASQGIGRSKMERIDSIIEKQNQLPLRQKDPLSAYNHVSRMLKERE